MKLVWLDTAKADLNEILVYIARKSGSAVSARRFVQSLSDKCRLLADSEFHLGRKRDELLNGLFSLSVGNYVIFFRRVEGRFEVVRILEGHRDIGALFETD